MKKFAILAISIVPFLAVAQKEIKPSLPKAEKAFLAGKFEEAKAIIDATVGSQEYMVDKKGQPTKNAARAYYVKALIYAGIDTTKNQAVKGLASNPLETAKEAFAKAYEIDGGKSTSFISIPDPLTPGSTKPVPDGNVKAMLAQVYLERAFASYNDERDYKKALSEGEACLYFVPKDTNVLFFNGVYFANAAEAYDKAITYIQNYIANGGKKEEATLHLVDIYYDKKKDYKRTLEEVKIARAKFPENTEFPKYELNIYIEQKQYDLARKSVLDDIQRDPNNKESWHRLGGLCVELNNPDSAKMAYQKAVDLDPTFYTAAFDLAVVYYQDAKKIKTERDKLGISAKDITKRKELFDQLQAKYKIALPYWERARKLQPDDEKVLYTLSEMYTSLVMDDKAAEVRKKMKQLGYSD